MKILNLIALWTTMISFVVAQVYESGDHELALMPTAYHMEKGQSYFTDWELVFLNYTYAITNKTHVSILSLFPMTTEFTNSLTLGIKHQYLNSGEVRASGILTHTPNNGFTSLGTVVSLGKKASGLHIATGMLKFFNSDNSTEHNEWVYAMGYRIDSSKRTSLMAEYANFTSFAEENFNGYISLGIRFRTHNVTWDLSGIRPLEKTEDFLFAPLLKATFLVD